MYQLEQFTPMPMITIPYMFKSIKFEVNDATKASKPPMIEMAYPPCLIIPYTTTKSPIL